jgi:Protein of unknown function (DUF3277)
MPAYSFLDVQASISGPGGAFSLGSGAGAAEEGITVEPTEDISSMQIGADGTGQHSLHANRSGRVTIRLLKTSPTNALLSAMYNFQTASSATHGQNTLTVTDSVRGDKCTCTEVAFAKKPSVTYAKEGAPIEWVFNCVRIENLLGSGSNPT